MIKKLEFLGPGGLPRMLRRIVIGVYLWHVALDVLAPADPDNPDGSDGSS